jgi:tol-pal system protein YbgF
MHTMVTNPAPRTSKTRAALLGAALAASLAFAPVGTNASTREELDRLAAQMAQMQQRMAQLEAQQAAVQKTLAEFSGRLDTLARSSQTADIRADLDILKRQLEALASQMVSPKGEPRGQIPKAQPEAGQPPPDAPPTAPHPAVPGSEDLYSQAHRDYLGGRYELATSQFRQFLESYPSDPKAPNAQYWAGECLYSQKRFAEALEEFQMVLQKHPQSAKAKAALLKIGLCHLAGGDTNKGRQILESLVDQDPGSDEAQLARERLDRLGPP